MGIKNKSTSDKGARGELKPVIRWAFASNLGNVSINAVAPHDVQSNADTSTPTATARKPHILQSTWKLPSIARWTSLLFGRTQQSNTSQHRRGVQSAVVLGAQSFWPTPPTAVAMIGPTGLMTYTKGITEPLASFHHNDRISVDIDDVANSSGSDLSRRAGRKRYEAIGADVNIVVGLIRYVDFDFLEMRPIESSSSPPSIEDQIDRYIIGPSSNPATIQIRILIASGHNSDTELVINDEIVYPWKRLRKAIWKIPTGVVLVIILACCYAGDVLNCLISEREDGARPARVTILASSIALKKSFADPVNGDYFLNGLFKALWDKRFQRCSNDWKLFLKLIMERCNETANQQEPVICDMAGLSPLQVFGALVNLPSVSPARGRSLPVTKS